ncbi:MAG: S8 family peptidase [Candidatus Zixiibacteriota bacterium]
MKKVIVLIVSLLIAAAIFLFIGCSSDMSTSPDNSANVLSQKLDSAPGMKDVLIGFSNGRPDDALTSAGAVIKKEYKYLPIVFASVPEENINRLRNNPNIAYIANNDIREFTAQTLDWGVDRIDADYVWTNTVYNGSGVNVAILDTGGDMDHPDLTWAGGFSAVHDDPSDFDDKVGHGTHCAGIVSANNNDIGVVGVAPNCDIYAVQISDNKFIYTDNVLTGIDWIIGTHFDGDAGNDIQVVNMSFGGAYENTAEGAAMLEMYNLGILLVSSAGNNSGPVSYPAKYDFIMAISASDQYDAFASFSNFGPEIELIAPGVRILSTYKMGKYWPLSGTSMASPMVVGAAAVAMQKYPNYTHEQIRALLNGSAEDIGLTAFQQGNGLVDVEKAVLGTTNGDDF